MACRVKAFDEMAFADLEVVNGVSVEQKVPVDVVHEERRDQVDVAFVE